jgi:hypothetical protein
VKSLGILGLAVCAALVTPALVTPARPQEELADTMELVRDKARADKRQLVADNLQLTEAEARAFWPVHGRYQRDLGAVNTRIANLIRDYGKNSKTMSDEVADRLITE